MKVGDYDGRNVLVSPPARNRAIAQTTRKSPLSIARIRFARFRALRAIGRREIGLRYCTVSREAQSRDRNSAISRAFIAIALLREEVDPMLIHFDLLFTSQPRSATRVEAAGEGSGRHTVRVLQ